MRKSFSLAQGRKEAALFVHSLWSTRGIRVLGQPQMVNMRRGNIERGLGMGRRNRRRGNLRADPGSRSQSRPGQLRPNLFLTRVPRHALLAGTALATTLMASAPTPASAQAVIIASNAPVSFTRNSDCVFIGTCLAVTTFGNGASISLTNHGDLAVAGPASSGIFTSAGLLLGFTFPNSPTTINNTGDIATAGLLSHGIEANSYSRNSPITITNSGDIATAGISASGLNGYTYGPNSNLSIANSGEIATIARYAVGIYGYTYASNSSISITNSGDVTTRGTFADGIYAGTYGAGSSITVMNSGRITTRGVSAAGINAYSYGTNSDILIINSGDITSTGFLSDGIYATTYGAGSSLTIRNSGGVNASGLSAYGINAAAYGASSPITIENSGDVYGNSAGIYTYSATSTAIINKAGGSISAGSGLAIDTEGAGTTIENAGLITGHVDLTDSADQFLNKAGGEFRAMKTSVFGGGSDLFRNEDGGVLRAASQSTNGEQTNFVGLEKFENKGLITMVDGRDNDVFTISNTPGGKDLTFVGSGDSTLAVDAFLGGPGSTADHFIVEGDASGRTAVAVNNTNSSSARYDPVGIPVVFVRGKFVEEKNFYMREPIDTGFFDYDLFFKPTGSGFFYLKNHASGGAHLLPELVTATHDVFHNTTETWFDQSTDLRVLLAQGATCSSKSRAQDEARCQQLFNVTPGVWVRGASSWFDLQDSATTKADGRTYHHNLDRNFDVGLFESGIDFGKRDLFAPGDILVFGVLGGATEATLDYKAIERSFNLDGGEVGAYATYLKGGFFADTLFKTIFAKLDPKEVRGFPDTLNSATYGFRTDAGYRFGGFRRGPFFEPLATIAASWTHIDDFTRDGNAVNFNDDANVRGRVGLRLGTSTDIWQDTTFEPFVVGSLWGTLSGNHTASLTSTGTLFEFTDAPEDLWGVVSGGVNFFNPSAHTSVFAKVDYTFADQTQGVGVRAGMRYNW